MTELNFSPFPTIETDRLTLRKFMMRDSDDLFQLRTSEKVMQFIERPKPKSKSEAQEMIRNILKLLKKNEAISWAITLKGQKKMIGTISFHRIIKEHHRAEIGYILLPKYWGKGIMSEAIRSVIDYGFHSLHLHSIEANVNPANEGSIAILLKHGFVKEAFYRENYFFNGKYFDTGIYSLLNKTD